MTPERADLEAVERLMTDYSWHADHRDAQAFAALFLPDGVLCLNGREMRGRAEIAEFCGQRFSVADRKTRHSWSNLRLEQAEGSRLITRALQLTFEQAAQGEATQLRVSDLFDEFQQDAEGLWRFARRDVRREL